MTLTLMMLIVVLNGTSQNASYGGPVVVDGFQSKGACEAYLANYKQALPKELKRGFGRASGMPTVDHAVCLPKS